MRPTAQQGNKTTCPHMDCQYCHDDSCTCVSGENNRNRSDITPDPGGHRPQRPCAQGRTRAKQDQAQASAPGQNRTRSVGGATTHGRRTRQASESVPTYIDAVGGWRVHTADDTPSRNAATRSKHCNCMYQGDLWPRAAAGTGQHKPWQQQREYKWVVTEACTSTCL